MNPGFSCFQPFLLVFAESSAPAQPGQGALHHPPAGQELELVAVRAPAHHPQQPTSGSPCPRYQSTGVGFIGPAIWPSPAWLHPGLEC